MLVCLAAFLWVFFDVWRCYFVCGYFGEGVCVVLFGCCRVNRGVSGGPSIFSGTPLVKLVRGVSGGRVGCLGSEVRRLGLGHRMECLVVVCSGPGYSRSSLIGVCNRDGTGVTGSLGGLRRRRCVMHRIGPGGEHGCVLGAAGGTSRLIPGVERVSLR